jgi:serine/threonine protein kinase
MGEDLPANNNNKESKYHLNHPLPVGTLLADRFKIIKVLGKGSFGVVYQCSEEKTCKMFAIKAFKRKF